MNLILSRLALVLLLVAAYLRHLHGISGPGTPIFRMLGLSALLAPVSFYIYILLRRSAKYFLPHMNPVHREALVLICAAVILVPSMYIFGLPLLFVLHVIVLALAVEILRLLSKLCGACGPRFQSIYKSGILPLCGALLIFAFGYVNMHTVHPRYETIHGGEAIPDAGFTIVFLSDLHFENSMTPEDLARYANDISKIRPDIVILGGDIVDERTSNAGMHAAFKILGNIKTKSGIFYIYGNHDRALYTAEPTYTEKELTETICAAGITILSDKSVQIAPTLTLTGREDRSTPMRTGIPRMEHKALIASLPEGAFHILADHQPREFSDASAAGFHLMLSGHTHHGQIWPLGHIVAALDKSTLIYGHKKEGNTDILVSSGIAGWGYPIRTQGQCEYVIIKIVK